MSLLHDFGRRGLWSYERSSHPGVGSLRLGERRLTCAEVCRVYRDVRCDELERSLTAFIRAAAVALNMEAPAALFTTTGRKWGRVAGVPSYSSIGNRHDQKRWTKRLAAAVRIASDALLDDRKDLALTILVEHVPLQVALDWLRPARLSDYVSFNVMSEGVTQAATDAQLLQMGVVTAEEIRAARFDGPIVGQRAEVLIIDDPYAAEEVFDAESEAALVAEWWFSNGAGVNPNNLETIELE